MHSLVRYSHQAMKNGNLPVLVICLRKNIIVLREQCLEITAADIDAFVCLVVKMRMNWFL